MKLVDHVQPTKENKYVAKRVYHFHRKPVMTTYVLQTHADWRISLWCLRSP